MAFGLLMRDNTPVDYPFRRSGRSPEEQVRLGYVPGGPYYPRSMPVQRALGYVPGGPYYPRGNPMRALGYVPGGPYYPRGNPMRALGGVPGVPGDFGGVPGVPENFGDDVPVDPNAYNTQFGPSPYSTTNPAGPAPAIDTTSQGGGSSWSSIGTGAANLATAFVNAFAKNNNPNAYPAGNCPAGYYDAGGRCLPIPQQSSGLGTFALVGALGLGALLLMRKKGA